MIDAKIIEDSVSPRGTRLTSFVLTYPRFIHSELMTHRAFSRNAASSRAIPFERMVKMVKDNTAYPVKWGSHQKGMQSGEEVEDIEMAEFVWSEAMREAVLSATRLDKLGVHKSISNRLLEPFAHMTTLVTATEWDNFFSLRAHKDAQSEFQVLAYEMLERYLSHEPRNIDYGEWHTPFVSTEEYPPGRTLSDVVWKDTLKVCVARCARVSYANFKESKLEDDVALHNRLMDSGHWSPFEHAAKPGPDFTYTNFRGWTSYRSTFPNENRTNVDLNAILAGRPK